MRTLVLVLAFLFTALSPAALFASDPAPPQITTLTRSNAQKTVTWTPYPAAQQYNLLSSGNVSGPYTNAPGVISGNAWRGTNNNAFQFYRLSVTPMSSNDLLSANILNRIAYGPTPDDLERLAAIGPQAYINEQLAPDTITDNFDSYTVDYVNPANPSPKTNWSSVSVTGTFSDQGTNALYRTNTLYMYLTKPGELFIDNVAIYALSTTYTTNWSFATNGTTITTNVVVTTATNLSNNLLSNGDFEQAPLSLTGYPPNWVVSTNFSASQVSATNVCSGAQSLHMVASSAGSAQGSSIWQTFLHSYFPANHPSTNIFNDPGSRTIVQCVLKFDYLPGPDSSILTLRLSGSGTIASSADGPTSPGWIYATATGTATATPSLYIYSSGAGEFYIDDLKLVRGNVPEAGANLLRNGDFESAFSQTDWTLTPDFTNTVVSGSYSHSGSQSLRVIATGAGSGNGDAVTQTNIAGVTNLGTYTVSFWYLPSTQGRTITVRLSGSGLVASPDTAPGGIHRRLDNFMKNNYISGSPNINTYGAATLADLRAWFVQNAVGSKRQLLEVLSQFLENHFVTEYSKSFDYLDQYYDNGGSILDSLAANWEYREMTKWRAALMRPDCTFYDLLKISAESPAMIVYLDTVNSRGDGSNIANENYAREILELFTMGVDNGYEQNDIVAQSRAWTGWSVEIVDPENIDNPFAPKSTTYGFYPGVNSTQNSNVVGVWTFNYKSGNHGTNRYPVLSVWGTNAQGGLVALGPKIVPARFGAPWAGTPYQLNIPRRTGTNSIQDGYDVIQHLANLPMTMEYISVKLCRLFVHDDFPNPTTRPELPEYAFYDYTNPNMSPEARLVHDCMLAWQNSTPRGNMRAVLATIFSSDLFRSHAGSMQKVKTPLEYTVSAVRALRSVNTDGSATATTDGYSIPTALSRMGNMALFNRDNPDGYPEYGAAWISAGTLAERLRYVQSMLTAANATPARPTDAGNTFADPVALMRKKIPGSMNNADAVADYFLGILYPAEGKANLDLYRTAAVNFLNTADDGTSSPLSALPTSNANYDPRIRGMVSYLMTLQRFHEQ